ncbi:MAG: hypothetical protein NC489_08970 [Ruminococcus flavefaciens]|nr:hypothetical protein [Ruminococcus flavefaciens]
MNHNRLSVLACSATTGLDVPLITDKAMRRFIVQQLLRAIFTRNAIRNDSLNFVIDDTKTFWFENDLLHSAFGAMNAQIVSVSF